MLALLTRWDDKLGFFFFFGYYITRPHTKPKRRANSIFCFIFFSGRGGNLRYLYTRHIAYYSLIIESIPLARIVTDHGPNSDLQARISCLSPDSLSWINSTGTSCKKPYQPVFVVSPVLQLDSRVAGGWSGLSLCFFSVSFSYTRALF